MKAISDAQAACLAAIDASPTVVLLPCSPEKLNEEKGNGRMCLWTEVLDRENNVGELTVWWLSDHPQPRLASFRSLLRCGYLETPHSRVVQSNLWAGTEGGGEPEFHEWFEVELSEDGRIALGVWRERKLKAPPAPLPTVTDREREVLAMAAEAERLGYVVVASKATRKEASSLRRRGFAFAGYVGASVVSLRLTATGQVEAAPHAADGVPG